VNPFVRWWRRRTLHARLSLLVTGAVAAAVLAVAGAAYAAVAEIQHHQAEAQLADDAQAIAAHPDQWRTPGREDPARFGRRGDDPHGPRDLGGRWQILSSNGDVVSQSTSALPVTDTARQVAAGTRGQAKEEVGIDGEEFHATGMLFVSFLKPLERAGSIA